MKRLFFPFCVFILVSVTIAGTSCKRSYDSIREVEEVSSYENGSKMFPEIGLNLEYRFSKDNPADFKITTSGNFTIDQFSNVYNKEQNLNYFTLTCKNNGLAGTYFVNGIVNIETKEATISYVR